MFRRVINPFLLLPLTLSMNTFNVLSSETKNYIDNVLEEKPNITFVDYKEIEKIVLNNPELKSLQTLVASASFNLSSQIAKRYPSLDFQANGLPKYVAGKNLPSYNTYENMPQESNGVGSIRSFLKTLSEKTKKLPKKVKKPKKVSWIVGKLVYEALIPTVKKLNLIYGLTINLYGLPSIYWGQDQVVTGLLTGEDLIYGLKNKDLGEAVYIPSIMLKHNTDLFLDDKNIQEVENKLNTKIHVLDDSNDIINTLIG